MVVDQDRVDALLSDMRRADELGAFVTFDPDRTRRWARHAVDGPLHGLPVVVKDNIHVAGVPNTAGTPALADLIPTADAEVVRRLTDAGAFVVGKTAMHELAFGVTGASSATGPTRNARHPARLAGGSSGGTAVAVACGAPAGLGTDTGGSVRIPAAFNGVCALRPTTGRYPSTGVTPLSSTRDTVGPIARTVEMLARLDAVLADDDRAAGKRPPATVRLGIPEGGLTDPLGERTRAIFADAVDRLRAAGVTLVDIPASATDGFDRAEAEFGFAITLFEARALLAGYLARYRTRRRLADVVAAIASSDVRSTFVDIVLEGAPGAVPPDVYRRAATESRRRLRHAYRDLFAAHRIDALLFPTTPRCAPLVGVGPFVDFLGTPVPTFEVFVRNTAAGSIAGLPGLSVPAPVRRGALPVGLALDGPEGSDRELLGIGITLQRLLGTDRPGDSPDL